MESAYGVYEPEFQKLQSGKTNLGTIVTIGTGLLTLIAGAVLFKIGCDRYLPQFSEYIKGLYR